MGFDQFSYVRARLRRNMSFLLFNLSHGSFLELFHWGLVDCFSICIWCRTLIFISKWFEYFGRLRDVWLSWDSRLFVVGGSSEGAARLDCLRSSFAGREISRHGGARTLGKARSLVQSGRLRLLDLVVVDDVLSELLDEVVLHLPVQLVLAAEGPCELFGLVSLLDGDFARLRGRDGNLNAQDQFPPLQHPLLFSILGDHEAGRLHLVELLLIVSLTNNNLLSTIFNFLLFLLVLFHS